MSQIGFKRPPSLFFFNFFFVLATRHVESSYQVSNLGVQHWKHSLSHWTTREVSYTLSFITNVTKVIIIGVNIFRAYRGLNNTCDYLIQSAHNPMK